MREQDGARERFGRAVRTLRIASGVSAREFGQAVGLSSRTISLVENGRRCVLAYRAVLIARELGVTVEYLFDHRWEEPA